jgi:lysozyme
LISPESKAKALVKTREGLVLKWYKDSLGKLTAGYGHLQRPGEEKLVVTQALADKWFEDDIAAAVAATKEQLSKLPFVTQELEDALVSVNFQLGTSWFKKFPRTWSYLVAGEYEKAAWESEDSLWAKQTPVRVRDFQRALWRAALLKSAVEAL